MQKNAFGGGGALRVAVLGLGRSGRAAVDFYLRAGALVTVYDENSAFAEQKGELTARGVRCCAGPFPPCFDGEVLVRSPVIRPDIPQIVASLAAGARLTDEVTLFLTHTGARVIGVTGSDGKSTTCALIAAVLRAAGQGTYLGGNNGTPLLARACEMKPSDFAVLELSSFQLMSAPPSPEIAVITNITPNHLDWHRDMGEYVTAKRNILRNAHFAVLSPDVAELLSLRAENAPPVAFFADGACEPPFLRPCDRLAFASGEDVVVREGGRECRLPLLLPELRLPGRHNVKNLLTAVAALWGIVPREAFFTALREFGGVPHRMQRVGCVGGVDFYDSSIDTSPARTAATLAALGRRPIVIVGGKSKGLPLAPLGDTLAQAAKAAFAYGDTAGEILCAVGGRIPATQHKAFRDAFFAAVAAAGAGDCILLSPGCTAFGEFRDFEERGECFCRLVKGLADAERKKLELESDRADRGPCGPDERKRL